MVLPRYHSTHMFVVKEAEQDTSDPSSYQDIPLLFPQENPEMEGNKYYSDEASSLDISSTSNSIYSMPPPTTRIRSSKSVVQMHDFVDDQVSRVSYQPVENGHHSRDNAHLFGGNGFHEEWWQDQERQGQVSSEDEPCQIGPRVKCACQVSVLGVL